MVVLYCHTGKGTHRRGRKRRGRKKARKCKYGHVKGKKKCRKHPKRKR